MLTLRTGQFVRMVEVIQNRWQWWNLIGQKHKPYFSESTVRAECIRGCSEAYATNRNTRSIWNKLPKTNARRKFTSTAISRFFGDNWEFIRYDPLKGVHVSWGPLLNLKLLAFFYFWNRNSLAVTLSMFII